MQFIATEQNKMRNKTATSQLNMKNKNQLQALRQPFATIWAMIDVAIRCTILTNVIGVILHLHFFYICIFTFTFYTHFECIDRTAKYYRDCKFASTDSRLSP